MSASLKVGISDIAIYLPRLSIELMTVIKKRTLEIGGENLEKVLRRALEKTGLSSVYFPEVWEDPVTMAAQAAYKLICRQNFNLTKLRYFVSGTETTVDHSKPIGAYVLGALKRAGLKIPQSLSTFQTQHACAGGTVALLGICALLGFAGLPDESGIVTCSDVAKYGKATSAEMTQGAGAVAMLAETNPRLVELDLHSAGYSSKDVDDFFRPIGSETAKVKGGFSVRCYMEAMESALEDHAARLGLLPEDVLRNTDMFALHVPYPKLPYETMKHLINKYLGINGDEADRFLEERGFFAMIEPASRSGNIYTGSLYMSLAFLLQERYKKFGKNICAKRIMFGSYGSGNTMVFLGGRIAENAPSVIERWNLEEVWDHRHASIHDYESWLDAGKKSPELYELELKKKFGEILPNSFYLNRIREDGYREYQYQE